MSKTERQQYKIAGPATWELVRAAYLAGESAPALAERFGVSVHAIRKRISVEKWSKRDYAAALEARGLEPPPKAKPVNVAERFAAHYLPPEPQPEPEHPFMELIAALKQASSAVEGAQAGAHGEAPAPDELERRALAQTGAALSKGRASDAKTFASLAEQMRKLQAGEMGIGTHRVENEHRPPERLSQDEAEEILMHVFVKAAYIAAVMVHAPSTAPAAFQNLIRMWREKNFGEAFADADAKAAQIAEAQAAYLSGDAFYGVPEEVQARLDAEWARRREVLKDQPLVPVRRD